MKHLLLLILLCFVALPLSAKKHYVIGFGEVCSSSKVSVNRTYVNAVLKSGHTPLIIPNGCDEKLLKKYVKKADIVFLTGGEDVNPAYYHAEPSPYLGEVVGCRDTFEMALLKEAVVQKKPIFGTCRGLQIINVFFGGSLYQDIPTEVDNPLPHRQGNRIGERIHDLNIEENSRLYKIMGVKHIGVNTSHHQAIKKLAPGLRVSARATDDIIEAIEGDSYPVAAVQFHPECLVEKAAPEFRKLYDNLMKLIKNK
jgi:putative glutamine amidotransferase